MKTFEELKNTDGLFLDSEDKRVLMEMPQLQREKILMRRYAKIQESEVSKQLRDMDRSSVPPKKVQRERLRYEDCDFILDRKAVAASVFKPFVSVIRGCFVRAKVNNDYCVCKIVGFSEIAPYALGDRDGQKCTLGINMDTGSKILRDFEISSISSSRITPEEFEGFVEAFAIESFDDLREKFRSATRELERNLTDQEMTKMIQTRLDANPRRQTSTQMKIDIIAKRDEAIARRDKQKAMDHQKQLEEIEDAERAERKRKHQEGVDQMKRRLQNK